MLRELLDKISRSIVAENKLAILKLLEPNKNAKVLELGPGDGSFTLELGKVIETDQLWIVDIMEKFVQSCKARGINAYHGDLNEPLPFEREYFDVVVANQIFEHLYNTDLFITEIYRVLKRGGYAIISTPNLAGWHQIACLFLGWVPFAVSLIQKAGVGNPLFVKSETYVETHPEHYRIPTYRGLKELLLYYGFQEVKIVGVGYYPIPREVARFISRLDPLHSVILTAKARKK